MNVGDSFALEALTTGTYSEAKTSAAMLYLAVTLPDGDRLHFERPARGGAAAWRATALTNPTGDTAFDEPISREVGDGLESLASQASHETTPDAGPAFARGTHVTPARPPREPDALRPFGTVLGGGTDPFTGDELVMVLWAGASKPRAHLPSELAILS